MSLSLAHFAVAQTFASMPTRTQDETVKRSTRCAATRVAHHSRAAISGNYLLTHGTAARPLGLEKKDE